MRRDVLGSAALFAALGIAVSAASASSYGDPASGFVSPPVQSAFIPLAGRSEALIAHGAAVVLAPGVAVTNAHNANLIAESDVLGRSAQYDLLFFRVGQGNPIQVAAPEAHEAVIAYGEGENGELRVARGTITQLGAPVRARCPSCAVQKAFVFTSNAGPGFSGGPVLDATDGHLVGITFGYIAQSGDRRRMFAYDMTRVNAEFAALREPVAVAAR